MLFATSLLNLVKFLHPDKLSAKSRDVLLKNIIYLITVSAQ